MPAINVIKIRRDTAANWTASNPTLNSGEMGYETDTGRLKVGDGSTAWTSLSYRFEAPAGYALLASPAFTGTPSLPTGTTGVTQAASNNSTKLATTAYVDTADALKANLASPTLTGVPAAPTAGAGTSTTQLATTAFVATSFAPLASPALTGTPTVPTATVGTSTTQAASTAFVAAATALDLTLTGGTMSGPIAMGTSKITGLGTPTAANDAVTKAYVDASVAGALIFQGVWDASVGTFPGAGVAAKGWFYKVSVGGTVNGIVFAVGDDVYAIATNASTTTYAANWQIILGGVSSSEVTTALGYTPVNKTGDTMSGVLAMGANKITGVASGSAAQDVAAFGQIPLVATAVPLIDGIATIGATGKWADSGHIHPTDTTRAALASPTFTGTPSLPTGATGVTQTAGNNTTALATTAFVAAAILDGGSA